MDVRDTKPLIPNKSPIGADTFLNPLRAGVIEALEGKGDRPPPQVEAFWASLIAYRVATGSYSWHEVDVTGRPPAADGVTHQTTYRGRSGTIGAAPDGSQDVNPAYNVWERSDDSWAPTGGVIRMYEVEQDDGELLYLFACEVTVAPSIYMVLQRGETNIKWDWVRAH